jgi:hypothetical protein
MAGGLVQVLKAHINNLKEEVQATKVQLIKYSSLRRGSIVLVDYAHINVAQSGVTSWIDVYKPTLLKYKDWQYCEKGFALDFNVLATQDDGPYESKYQPEYSGLYAKIEGPQRVLSLAKKRMEHVSVENLPLYIGFAHTTPLFRELLKGAKLK